MGLIFLILLGLVLGWLATIILQAGNSRNLMVNLTSGVGGAILAGIVINPLIGLGNLLRGAYSVEALLVSFAGAISLLVAVNLLQRGEMR